MSSKDQATVLGSSDTASNDGKPARTAPLAASGASSSVPEDTPGSAILAAQIDIPAIKPQFFGFWAHATPYDIALTFVGLFFAIVEGAALPMFTLVAGALTNNFNDILVEGVTASSFTQQVDHNTLYFVYIGVGILCAGALSSSIMANRGEVIASRFRKIYLERTLAQNIAYFDKLGAGEVSTRITNSTTSIQEAISEKLGTIVSGIATFVTAIAISFATQWKLSAILLSGVFFIIGDMVVGSTFLISNIQKSEAVYTEGSSIVEESISAIRTSAAFGIQDRLVRKFDTYLERVEHFSLKKYVSYAFMVGILWGAIFFIYALSFWEGSRILVDGDVSIGHIFVVVTSMLIGAFQFGNIAPEAQYIVQGLSSLGSVNETIKRDPPIDSCLQGATIEDLEGHIEFEQVEFRYPSRPDVLVLPSLSLSVPAGQTVALVGGSGCGKSTCVGILERFYNPLSGRVTIDGVDISTLDVKWLRRQIGLVSQEPTLFAVSIRENIGYGLIGTSFEHVDAEKKNALIEDACRAANAWDFIQQLDEGLETNVGDRGFLLSGGQKQRIAIARAIVSNPRILLLDEATSALDTKSEGIVQAALDRAAKGRTTITIAHRLSTIRKADKIVVMAKGEVVESGTHDELLQRPDGVYAELVRAQNVTGLDEGEVLAGDGGPETPAPGAEAAATAGAHVPEEKLALDPVAETEENVEEPRPSVLSVMALLWRLQSPRDHFWIYIGFIASIALGYGYPAMAILVGKSIASMIVPSSEYHQMRTHLNLYTGMLFMVGVEQIAAAAIMVLALSKASESLIREVRRRMFKQFLRMDMSFFDDKRHTAGALTSMIGKDGKDIEGLGGSTIGQIMQSFVILIGGVIQGIAFDWRLGLVAMATVPAMIGSGYLRFYMLSRFNERSHKVYSNSGALAAAYASAVRTVQALTLEDTLCANYNTVVDAQVRDSVLPLAFSGCIYGLSHAIAPWVIALIFWYGSKLLSEGKITVYPYFVVFIGGVMGAQAAGSIFNFAPNMGKAKQASQNVYNVLNTLPVIDHESTQGQTFSSLEGTIEFKDVWFNYPTRRQVPVLRGLNLTVKPGQFIALVGPSGCGKSTCIQLVEHFYSVDRGQVLFDGNDVEKINVANLRSHISLVQQEPLLYHGTVRENILFGWPQDEPPSDEQLFDVCKRANIHDFILGLPDGYDTDIGAHGGLLSGGQKQRVAIARALIRNPKILLLDEATSALDSQSEKVVQAALDEAAKGRTTIAVAHRLSTIEKADCIFVFDKGRIVEQGTHEELLKLNGAYAELVRLQSLES